MGRPDMSLEFGLLTAEVGEAFTAWRKTCPPSLRSLADVFFYFAASTEMNGIDLQEELNASSPRTRPVSTNVTLAESPSASKMRHSRTQRSSNVVLRRPHSSLHSAALMDLRTCLWLPRSQRTCHVRFAGGVQRCHQS